MTTQVTGRILSPSMDTIASVNNLASTLAVQGDYKAARRIQGHVVELMTRLMGKEHPKTLRSMGNLSITLAALGEDAEAVELQTQVADVMTRVLGEQHPDTATAMANLALLNQSNPTK